MVEEDEDDGTEEGRGGEVEENTIGLAIQGNGGGDVDEPQKRSVGISK